MVVTGTMVVDARALPGRNNRIGERALRYTLKKRGLKDTAPFQEGG